jgi:hypothetical protein
MQFVLAAKSAVGYVLNQIAGLAKALKFNAATASFTAGMAKRLPPAGPFAAALVVQGNWDATGTGDAAYVNVGSAISGYFYPVFDRYQGSIVLWVTPEWNGNDGLTHTLLSCAGSSYQFDIVKESNSILYCYFGNKIIGASVSSWVAGTTYCIVARWDSKNTLDGTNYICLSVNDVHTFGGTSSPLVDAPAYIRMYSMVGVAPNAIIQGLTIYRRPLFDGAYGLDLSNGDEINLIYNAGSGTDPTEITGSWDVCLCVPTNATPGALTTGSTDAWSHPHSSEVLTDTFCQRAYASSAWGDVGTPVTPVSVAFNGTNSAAGTKITLPAHASINDLAVGDCTLEMWFRDNKTSDSGVLFKKGWSSSGLYVYTNTTGSISTYWHTSGTRSSTSTAASVFKKGVWNHLAVIYINSSRTLQIYINGINVSGTATPGTGSIPSDAGEDAVIGINGFTYAYLGAIGWVRISNSIRYTENFTPPPRSVCPANDANTVRLFPMNAGSGTTITDLSTNAQNGTLSNGTWNAVRDLATDAPGERIGNWGYISGSDAANEGISQTLSGLTAGADYVLRPELHYSATAIPKVQILDATNGDAVITSITCPDKTANLVLNGGFDSDTGSWTASNATLASVAGGASGNCLEVTISVAYGGSQAAVQLKPYSTYRITFWYKKGTGNALVMLGAASAWSGDLYSSAIETTGTWVQKTGTFTTTATGLCYIGLRCNSATVGHIAYFDSITLTRVIDSKRPWCEPFSFELPTVARNGVAADCTSIKVQVLNTTDSGEVAVHQVELLPNLIDNPSLDVIAGDPGIPAGWTNSGLDAGDTEDEISIVHSVGHALQWNAGAGLGAEGILQAGIDPGANRHVMGGIWVYGASNYALIALNGEYTKQRLGTSGATGRFILNATSNLSVWKHYTQVARRTAVPGIQTYAQGATFYTDDAYLVALDPVTLTCVPASLANSTE